MTMASSADATLNRKMRSYLDDFYTSLQSNGGALNSFLGTLSTFNDTFQLQQGKLQQETLGAIHKFASIINTVASSMLELEDTTTHIHDEAVTDLSKIIEEGMNQLTISNDNRRHQSPANVSRTFPAYIKPSYQWLLLNLHNPYPKKDIKKDISRQTNCSIKDIDAWFIDARKRIGWNRLRKTRFSNKQEKIIAAATQVLRPKASSFSDDFNVTMLSQLDPHDLYRPEFIAMERNARSLYADRFPEMVTSISLDNQVAHDSTISPLTQIRQNLAAQTSQISDSNLVAASYPSPEPSPREVAGDDYLAVSTLAVSTLSDSIGLRSKSLKRRQSLAFEGDDSGTWVSPSKRLRSEVHSTIYASAVASLPSPSLSIDFSDDTSQDGSSIQVAIECTKFSSLKRKRRLSGEEGGNPAKQLKALRYVSENSQLEPDSHPHIGSPHTSTPSEVLATDTSVISRVSLSKRKRRLSDAETQCPPKRPHNALAQPRLQTVSDPFPIAKLSLESLFGTLSEDGDIIDKPGEGELLPVHSNDSLSLRSPLEFRQYDIPITLSVSGPEGFFSCLANHELPAPCTSERSEYSNLDITSCYPETLQDPLSNIIPNITDISDWLPAPDYDLSLPTELTSLTENLSQCFSRPLDVKAFNYESFQHEGPSLTNSVDAKRARLQELREQVWQLEGQLAGQLSA